MLCSIVNTNYNQHQPAYITTTRERPATARAPAIGRQPHQPPQYVGYRASTIDLYNCIIDHMPSTRDQPTYNCTTILIVYLNATSCKFPYNIQFLLGYTLEHFSQ